MATSLENTQKLPAINYKMPHRRKDDWKEWKTGWQYKKNAPRDPQWREDRERLFKKNGNGWWLFTPSRTIRDDDLPEE